MANIYCHVQKGEMMEDLPNRVYKVILYVEKKRHMCL